MTTTESMKILKTTQNELIDKKQDLIELSRNYSYLTTQCDAVDSHIRARETSRLIDRGRERVKFLEELISSTEKTITKLNIKSVDAVEDLEVLQIMFKCLNNAQRNLSQQEDELEALGVRRPLGSLERVYKIQTFTSKRIGQVSQRILKLGGEVQEA